MTKKPFRWTAYRKLLRDYIQHPDAGTPRESWERLRVARIRQFKDENPDARPSEIAMAISAEREEFLDIVRRCGLSPWEE